MTKDQDTRELIDTLIDGAGKAREAHLRNIYETQATWDRFVAAATALRDWYCKEAGLSVGHVDDTISSLVARSGLDFLITDERVHVHGTSYRPHSATLIIAEGYSTGSTSGASDPVRALNSIRDIVGIHLAELDVEKKEAKP